MPTGVPRSVEGTLVRMSTETEVPPAQPAPPAAEPAEARHAATVVIVRPHTIRPSGCEVLLLKRTSKASFVAGAHVFPGGAVDGDDARIAHGLPGEYVDQFVVAAIRECFEEAGLLFAHRRSGVVISPEDRIRWRLGLARGDQKFGELLASEDLVLDTAPLRYWSRWITPVGLPKRFDARFFLAPEPAGQHATPDETEITESGWFSPEDALRSAESGEMLLILPTRMTLQTLAFASTLAEFFG
jgi:8-oxo-dGTP pyrophosphatase MutT (NUDIX family)